MRRAQRACDGTILTPLELHTDNATLVNAAATEVLKQEMGEGGDCICDLCGEVVPFEKEKWRGHIGWHVLRAICRAPEPRPLISPVRHCPVSVVL